MICHCKHNMKAGRKWKQQPLGSKIPWEIYDWCNIHASLFSFSSVISIMFFQLRSFIVYYFSFCSTVIYVFLLFNWRNASSAWCWRAYVRELVHSLLKASWYVSNMRKGLKTLENMCRVIVYVCLQWWK